VEFRKFLDTIDEAVHRSTRELEAAIIE